MGNRIYNANNDTWSFHDGTSVITREMKLNKELLNDKWKERHILGKVDIEQMLIEFDKKPS